VKVVVGTQGFNLSFRGTMTPEECTLIVSDLPFALPNKYRATPFRSAVRSIHVGPESEELYQAIIVDHDGSPRNFRVLPDATHSSEGYNPLCGDHYRIFVRSVDGHIEEISFVGRGCAISRASASIMTTLVRGLSHSEAESLIRRVNAFLTSGETGDVEELGDLAALRGVHRFPTRQLCALLAWSGLEAALSIGYVPGDVT